MNEEKNSYYEKREGVSKRERGSRFNERHAIGPDSADLVSFANKRPRINTLTKTSAHMHTTPMDIYTPT